MKLVRLLSVVLIILSLTLESFAQEEPTGTGGYEDLLYREVEVENPVYMPVISIGPGIITYFGELNNDYGNLLTGRPSVRFNLYQFLDKKHYTRGNIFVIYGYMTGENKTYIDPANRNVNFETDLFAVGLNFEYNFGHLYKREKRIRPFFSIGGEYFAFNSKTDIIGQNGEFYNYLADGTIRNSNGDIINRDYDFESDSRSVLDDYGRTDNPYETNKFAVVADVGFDLTMGDRVTFRLASSLHYTFTDDIDLISSDNTQKWIGDNATDMFAMTYCTFNFDLFSSDETIIQELMFADLTGEFDYELISDNDRDGILDIIDDCPETPRGEVVDSVGCPLDQDDDGVPDYKDKEFFTRNGAIVDENGVEMHPDKILETLKDLNIEAVDRDETYMIPITLSAWSKYSESPAGEIPEKFSRLDQDKDNYISFDELLDAIDLFFDSETEFNTEDIYELNEFFFSQ